MNLSIQNLARARKLALVAVAGSVSVVALAALVLPPAIAGVLPLLALTVPFIAAGILESCIDHMSRHQPAEDRRADREMWHTMARLILRFTGKELRHGFCTEPAACRTRSTSDGVDRARVRC